MVIPLRHDFDAGYPPAFRSKASEMIGPDVFQYEVIYLSGGGKASSPGFALGPAIAAPAEVSLDDINERIERVVSLRSRDRDFESVETHLSHLLNGFSHLNGDKKGKSRRLFWRRRSLCITEEDCSPFLRQ